MAPEANGSQTQAAVLSVGDGTESQDSDIFISCMHRLHGAGASNSTLQELAEYNKAVLARDQRLLRARARVRAQVQVHHTPLAASTSTSIEHAAAAANTPLARPVTASFPTAGARKESEKEQRNNAVSLLANAHADAGARLQQLAITTADRQQKQPNPTPEPATDATVQGQHRGLDAATCNVNPPTLYLHPYSVRQPPIPQQQTNFTDASSSRVNIDVHPIPASDTNSGRVEGLQPMFPCGAPAHPLISPNSLLGRSQSRYSPAPTSRHNDSHGDADHPDKSPDSRTYTHINPTYGPKRGESSAMEYSESPTQSNGDRSYEQYLARGDDLLPSDPFLAALASQEFLQDKIPSNNEAISLNDDDTGAVKFNISTFGGRSDTQPSALCSGALGLEEDKSQMPSSPRIAETPAPARNPFSGLEAAPGALMASSQMFKHTQFSSAHKPVLSPTSSRPSPDNLRASNTISPISSPLKRVSHGSLPLPNGSSNLATSIGYPTSSPRVSDEEEEEEEEEEDEGEQEQEQVEHGHSKFGCHGKGVKERSKMFHGLLPRAPIESYEPYQRSQQEQSASAHAAQGDVSDEDFSDVDYRRRQRVAQRRAAAAQNLRSISFERVRTSNADDEVVVPSTHNDETHNTNAQQYLAQCEGFFTRDSQNSIADTQVPIEGSQDSVAPQHSTGHALESNLPEHNIPRSLEHMFSVEATVPNTDPNPSPAASGQAIRPDEEHNTKQGGSAGPVTEIPETSPIYSHTRRLRPSHSRSPVKSSTTKPIDVDELVTSTSRPGLTDTQKAEGPFSPRPTQDKTPMSVPRASIASSSDDTRSSPNTNFRSSPPILASRVTAEKQGGRQDTSPSHINVSPTTPAANSPSTSPLSRLSATPELFGPKDETPLTEKTHAPAAISSLRLAQSSPAAAKVNRQRTTNTVPNAVSNQTRTSLRRSKKTYTPESGTSADELALTPLTPLLHHTRRSPRANRSLSKDEMAPREMSRGTKIFTGMLFAVSFQVRQPGEKEAQYKARISLSEQITNKIRQAGGRLLTDGFDKLFETAPAKPADRNSLSSTPDPDDEIELVPSAQEASFTALIADGHSRKVKYMQALALGLPCIHQRWITVCIDSQQLVDWSHYLLCAGNSSFLGDAVKSRNLLPYDASSARLCEVIRDRPRLLQDARILLVTPAHRGSEAGESSSKKEAYIFLARVLGASLSRVYTVEEAKMALKAREEAGRPFDWVYVDEKMAGHKDLFVTGNNDRDQTKEGALSTFTSGSTCSSIGKKRKRKGGGEVSTSMTASATSTANMTTTTITTTKTSTRNIWGDRPPKRVRMLSNELVIQSLILGRLMDEDELPPG